MASDSMPIYRQLSDFLCLAFIVIELTSPKTEHERLWLCLTPMARSYPAEPSIIDVRLRWPCSNFRHRVSFDCTAVINSFYILQSSFQNFCKAVLINLGCYL